MLRISSVWRIRQIDAFSAKAVELPDKHDRMMTSGQKVKTCIIGVKIPFSPNILKWTEAGGEKYGKDGWNCELTSITYGIAASDAMLKAGQVRMLRSARCPGK